MEEGVWGGVGRWVGGGTGGSNVIASPGACRAWNNHMPLPLPVSRANQHGERANGDCWTSPMGGGRARASSATTI